jgi:hypothetical protein
VPPPRYQRPDSVQLETEVRGLEVSEVRRLKTLDDENKKLKQVFAEQLLEITAIRAALAKKW